MKNQSETELELAGRMAGEVYPELLKLIAKDGVNSIVIHSADIHDIRYEKVSQRFIISSKGIITDWDRLSDGSLAGESDEVADEPINKIFDINNVKVCPIFESCKDICYKYYCEQVLIAIDMLLLRERRMTDIFKKIDKIPFRRQVIIEKK